MLQCDEDGTFHLGMERLRWKQISHNPFAIFPVANSLAPSTLLESSLDHVARELPFFPDMPEHERFLLHHYVTHVAAIMFPSIGVESNDVTSLLASIMSLLFAEVLTAWYLYVQLNPLLTEVDI